MTSPGHFEVVDPGPLTTVQDLGRRMLGAYGVAEGGALDRGAHRRANRLAGNPPGTAGLEITLKGPVLRWRGRRGIRCGWVGDAEAAFTLDPGEELDIGGLRRRVRGYLAIAGGIEVPRLLGSRSTCMPGAFGGLQGRALKAGDRLEVGVRAPRSSSAIPGELAPPSQSVRVVAGPHAGARTFAALVRNPWRVGPSDRVGLQLAGDRIAVAPLRLSIPMTPGCIEITGAGQPIVLLRDHPTVGGYPVVAVVIRADLDRLAQLRPGTELSLRPVSETTARQAARVLR